MILETLFRRSIENPNTPLTDWGYSTQSDSGLNISYSSALKYSPWWRGVNLVSRDVAKLPLSVYKRQGEGKDKDIKHPAYPLLRRKANPELTAFIFIQTLTANAMACGNGYAYIFRDQDAKPLELRWLDPLATYPMRENGVLLYVTAINNVFRRLLPENVLHVRGLGYDGLVGYPVYVIAADSLGLGIGAQKYEAKFFANSARPSVVIEYPGNVNSETVLSLREQWDRMHQGLENSHRTAVLTNGAKINPFSINARDAQLLESRQFEIREVANWLGVPPHKLGDTTRTAYASLEQENYSYLVEALDPWLVAWESECNEKLLTEKQKESESHFVEFNRNALVRASFAERMAGYNTALQGGWMNRNEVRSKENMNPLPDGEGEKFYQPLNMQTVGGDVEPAKVSGGTLPELEAIVISVVKGEIPADAAKVLIQAAYPALDESEIDDMLTAAEEQEPPAEPQPEAIAGPLGKMPMEPPEDMPKPKMASQAFRGVIEDVAERMTKRLGIAARKAAKKPNEFLSWLDNELPTHTAVIADALGPVVAAWRAMGSEGQTAEELSSAFIELWRDRLLTLSEKCTIDTMPTFMEGALVELEANLRDGLTEAVVGKDAPEPPAVVIHNHVNVAAAPVPQVNVAPQVVNVAASPTPEVHIAPAVVNVAAPVVNVAPAKVTVQPPNVDMHMHMPEEPEYDIEPVRDEKTGLAKRFRRVRKDKNG